jgi:WD40 repeat protein
VVPWKSRLVTCVAFSPDGKVLASGSWSASTNGDHPVKLWDVATGKSLLALKGHTNYINSVAFGRGGKTLASGGFDQTARLWDARTGRELLTMGGHRGTVQAVAFSPDGKLLATGSNDQAVRLWNVPGGHTTNP